MKSIHYRKGKAAWRLGLALLALAWVILPPNFAAAQSTKKNPAGIYLKKGDKALFGKKDYTAAMTWYQKAADLGDAQGQNQVGWIYQMGYGVQVDYDEAMNWYQKAAAQGLASAEERIGELYFFGNGVEQNQAEGMVWIKKSALQGNAEAEYRLGDAYLYGFGVAQDDAEGLNWLKKAAEQGSDAARKEVDHLKSMSADTNSPDLVTTPSGLQYQVLRKGKGPVAQKGQLVTVHYTGWLTDGTQFDSSVDRGKPFQFTLGEGQVIRGWDEGVAGMKVGEKRKLIVPPELGYGASGTGNVIPPNAKLVFNVELLDVSK